MKKYCILGTDSRSNYLRELYKEEGKKLVDYISADYVITSIPFTRDNIKLNNEDIIIEELISNSVDKIIFSGSISDEIKEKFKINNIKFYDVLDNEKVTILNSIPTSEGAILEAIKMSDITLCNSNVLVMGYGNIGKILSKMLLGIGCNVYVEARKEKDIVSIISMGYKGINLKDLDSYLYKFDYIFNTIPYLILDNNRLDLVKKDCCIIDLASNPGGIDFEYANNIGLKVKWALALPSKVAPKSAAIYIKEEIDRIIKDDVNDN
jgi:dipicolinate synthase subunit A